PSGLRGVTTETYLKRRMREIRKVSPIRISFEHQLVPDIKLQMITVRPNHRIACHESAIRGPNSEAAGPVTLRGPLKARLQNDFFFRIALSLVKVRRGFRQPEDVADPVIADAIAGAKVIVRVIVKSAPADPAGVLR